MQSNFDSPRDNFDNYLYSHDSSNTVEESSSSTYTPPPLKKRKRETRNFEISSERNTSLLKLFNETFSENTSQNNSENGEKFNKNHHLSKRQRILQEDFEASFGTLQPDAVSSLQTPQSLNQSPQDPSFFTKKA